MSTGSGEARDRKPLVFLEGEIKAPPFTPQGLEEAGTGLREIQEGESLGMPISPWEVPRSRASEPRAAM